MSKVFCTNPNCFFFSMELPPEVKECLYCKSPVKVEQDQEDSNQGKPGESQIKWCKEAFETFPCVLAHEYKRLYKFHEDKNVYGLFMQLKDCLEVTVKYCVLSVFACGHGKKIPGKEIYEKKLPDELVFGKWYEMLRDICGLQDHSWIPESLFEFAKAVFGWVKSKSVDLVNWRNEYVGHGALAFEDDPEFIKSVYSVIQYLSDFYTNHYDLICKIRIRSKDEVYAGYQFARNLSKEEDACFLEVDGAAFPFEPFVRHIKNGIFFYDSLLRAKQSKLLCYPTGHSKRRVDSDILSLREQRTDLGRIREQSIESGTITLQQYDAQARLSINERYVKPVALIRWLDDEKEGIVHKYSKGVFLLEMERGCGKTYFAEKLNSRFSGAQKLSDGSIDIRTVHLAKSQVGGVSRFLKDLSNEWRLAEKYEDIILEASDMPAPDDDLSCNAKALADFLNDWKKRSADHRGKNRIMLVLDGLDEIGELDSIIWSYIPQEELLEDGVYILLTSRCAAEDLPAQTKSRLDGLRDRVQSSICIKADSNENKATLVAFVQSRIEGVNKELTERIISGAEYRLLYTAMLCELVKKSGEQIDLEGKREISLYYLQSLEQYYGEGRSVLYKTLLSVLLSVGKGEGLSLGEIADLLQMGVIRFELLDMLQDLSPLMTIERGYQGQDEKIGDANRYHFANDEVASAVLEYVGREFVAAALSEYMDDLQVELVADGNNAVYSDGIYAYLAKLHVFIYDIDGLRSWQPSDVKKIKNYIDRFPVIDETKKQLNLNRHMSAEMGIYEVCRRLPFEQLFGVKDIFYAVSHNVADHLVSELLYEKALEVMEYELSFRKQAADSESKSEIVSVLFSMADLHCKRIEHNQAIKELDELIQVLGPSGETHQDRLLKAKVLVKKVEILMGLPGDPRRNSLIDDLKKAKAILRGLKKKNVDVFDVEMQARYLYAIIQRDMYLDNQCVETFEVNIALARRGMKSNPGVAREWLANNLNSLGGYYKNLGDHTGVIRYFRESASLREEAYRLFEELYAENENKYADDFGLLCNTNGNVMRSMRKFDEGIRFHLKGIEVREKLVKRDPKAFGMKLATSYKNYGHLLGDKGDYEEAELNLLKAIRMFEEKGELNSVDEGTYKAAYYNLIDAYLDSCQRKNAIPAFLKLVDLESYDGADSLWKAIQTPVETGFPLFLKNTPDCRYDDCKENKFYIEKMKRLQKDFESARNSESRVVLAKKICWHCYAVYKREKNSINLRNCVLSALHILESMDDKTKKRYLFGVVGESLAFLLSEDMGLKTDEPVDLVRIGTVYYDLHSVLIAESKRLDGTLIAKSQYLDVTRFVTSFALSVYREYLAKYPEGIEFIAEHYCILNNNLGMLLYQRHESFKAIELLEVARSLVAKMMGTDELPVLLYAKMTEEEMIFLKREKLEDYDKCIAVGHDAYDRLIKLINKIPSINEHINKICSLLNEASQSSGEGKSKGLIHRIKGVNKLFSSERSVSATEKDLSYSVVNLANSKTVSDRSPVYFAAIAPDAMLFFGALFGGGKEVKGALKKGEVAFRGLRKPKIKIYDPENPAHCIVCKNDLSYPQEDSEVVYMNPVDYSYFKELGFEAGDVVYIVEA